MVLFPLSHGGSSSIFPSPSLELSDFDFKDEVPCNGEAGTLAQIGNLTLNYCKNLKHMWKKDSELAHLLSILQTLTVDSCDDLINIGPALVIIFSKSHDFGTVMVQKDEKHRFRIWNN
ncbi:hypothetical protein V6N13_042678 [Hibiscus sabdariffa]|uniref:Disease resistance protein At4g27190-like leucine-rich repeats domain-containing protein n=1 Tax=Hibiscus sabdariffa TaxID=183260 RepID=A0ABR2G3X0_9ROSI